ncbi:MAG: hypothetical protein BWZ10_02300 [candidate division BRC1 bacterium ADurb.BinA364]|nr:MAG: hypothetical protein BWZ10_02300 [candidate division BRC1 bacterium ADurb.BinA364]
MDRPATRHIGYLGKAEDVIAGKALRQPQTIVSRSSGVAAIPIGKSKSTSSAA